MKALSPLDQLFLWAERRQQPMHVGGLMLFSFPESAGPSHVTRLAEYLREYKVPQPPFSSRLVQKYGRYYWHYDKQFDLEHHFRHEALPKPGRIRELLTSVSAEHSNLMDRKRPLWECHLIEGVRGKRFALYTKVHHAMIDGVSAMRMLVRALNEDDSVRNMPPFWAIQPNPYHHKQLSPELTIYRHLRTFLRAGKQAVTLPNIMKEAAHSFVQEVSQKEGIGSDYVSIFQAPTSILNQSITGSRRFAAQSYSIERLKKIAKAFDATLNDIILAVCGSALRDYLISQNGLPNKPLIALVPVSTRQDDSIGGNEVAGILANLGTHIADPQNRLMIIKASVEQAKKRYESMSSSEMLNYTAMKMLPALLHMATGALPRCQAFNVIISNVPGPKKPLFWNGAQLQGTYPISVPVNQIALNITTVSYVDQMEFGLTACRRSLPSMQRMLDYIENGIRELEVASGIV